MLANFCGGNVVGLFGAGSGFAAVKGKNFFGVKKYDHLCYLLLNMTEQEFID